MSTKCPHRSYRTTQPCHFNSKTETEEGLFASADRAVHTTPQRLQVCCSLHVKTDLKHESMCSKKTASPNSQMVLSQIKHSFLIVYINVNFGIWSVGNAASIMTRLRGRWSKVRVTTRERIFFYSSKGLERIWGPFNLLSSRHWNVLSRG